jgi:hypothetical protein
MKRILPAFLFLLFACSSSRRIAFPARKGSMAGTDFYKEVAAYNWAQRDSLAVEQFRMGNVPDFLKKFKAVKLSMRDSVTGRIIKATVYVAPDYFSIGTNRDWCRVPITPMAAQKIADSLHCFLPTRKIVDAIYNAAVVKLEPVPMFAYRDSSPTMYQHHLVIEGQRKQRRGLIAGIKKDIVITCQLNHGSKMNRVAIYGWQRQNGKPIQALYTGHVNWYVDYSHGVRLVYRKLKVGRQWIDYTDILKDSILSRLICDEEYCDFNKYSY